jgi:thymidine phosphorylase
MFPVLAAKNGYITKMDCKALGLHCVHLGGGRQRATDLIDFSVGFVMNKKIGEKVKKGELLALIHCHENQMELAHNIAESMKKSDIVIGVTKTKSKKKLIIEVQTKFAPKKKR